MSQTPHPAIKVHKGVSIYQVGGSQFWYVRVWDRQRQCYRVASTGETSAVKAKKYAQLHALSLLKAEKPVDHQFTFKHFAIKCLSRQAAMAASGEKNANYVRTLGNVIDNQVWGLMARFGDRDVRELKTRDFQQYMDGLLKSRDLSASMQSHITAAFRNVLKEARDEGVIDALPDTPRKKQRDNPRPFFRFDPIVSKDQDAYKKLLAAAEEFGDAGVSIRGVPVTQELRDIILFLTHSFVRPLTTELYAIRHNDVTVNSAPRSLAITIRRGKTGARITNTMPAAVSVYDRIRQRYPNAKGEDYLFLPQYSNRETASKIIQRQFKELLRRAGLETDPFTGKKHELYSLRHTAICMRLVLSHGKVNIYTLAKNAGTSVDQIERFYAKYLPLSPELVKNLHSFGEG